MFFSSQKRRPASRFLHLVLLTCMFPAGSFASGAIDPTFNAYVQNHVFGQVNVSAKQADGKILVGGRFWTVNGIAARNVARLNADGTIDPSFNPPEFYSNLNSDTIHAIAVQSDGKILVGGRFDGTTDGVRSSLCRLNSDGSIDSTFPVLGFGP